jgi:hypothetical protein
LGVEQDKSLEQVRGWPSISGQPCRIQTSQKESYWVDASSKRIGVSHENLKGTFAKHGNSSKSNVGLNKS